MSCSSRRPKKGSQHVLQRKLLMCGLHTCMYFSNLKSIKCTSSCKSFSFFSGKKTFTKFLAHPRDNKMSLVNSSFSPWVSLWQNQHIHLLTLCSVLSSSFFSSLALCSLNCAFAFSFFLLQRKK
jgi:hypothetical protein